MNGIPINAESTKPRIKKRWIKSFPHSVSTLAIVRNQYFGSKKQTLGTQKKQHNYSTKCSNFKTVTPFERKTFQIAILPQNTKE